MRLMVRCAAVVIAVLLTLGLVEVALRLVPTAIPPAYLLSFHPIVRASIARAHGFATLEDVKVISTEARSDRGPSLFLPLPGQLVGNPLDRADEAAGASAEAKVDNQGFCNPPGAENQPHSEIVIAGDSFTFCLGVQPEETAVAQLGALTGRSVYNLGVEGIGPHEYVELLKQYGIVRKPQLVVLNIYEGNDLRDAVRFERFQRGLPEDDDDQPWQVPPPPGLLAQSYALSLISAGSTHLWNLRKGRLPDETIALDFRYRARVQGRIVEMNVTNTDTDEILLARAVASGKVTFESLSRPLEELVQLGARDGFASVITYVPSMYSAYADTVVFNDPSAGKDVVAFSDAQRSWLRTKAAQIGATFVDLTPAFRASAHAGPLTHFPASVHLTPSGHAVVARELESVVRGVKP